MFHWQFKWPCRTSIKQNVNWLKTHVEHSPFFSPLSLYFSIATKYFGTTETNCYLNDAYSIFWHRYCRFNSLLCPELDGFVKILQIVIDCIKCIQMAKTRWSYEYYKYASNVMWRKEASKQKFLGNIRSSP